jgi:siroheme synthase-like protein
MDESLCPVGLNIAGRRIVFAGAGAVAQRKLQRVLNSGAEIIVIAPEATADIQKLAEQGDVAWLQRAAIAEDFANAFLAFVATNDSDQNRALADAARLHGALVNQADDAERCDFVLPALAFMNTVKIGIFSDSPALSKWVRRYLERTLGQQFPEFAGWFGHVRQRIRRLNLPQATRAEILTRLLNEGIYQVYLSSGPKAAMAHTEAMIKEYEEKQKP